MILAMTDTGRGSHLWRAVVFDLDGVLVDTEVAVFEVWREVFERYGCQFTRGEWCVGVGSDSGFEPWAVLRSRCSLPLPERRSLERSVALEIERRVADLAPRPGVVEWLREATDAGLQLGVASSSPPPWVEKRLAGAGLAAFFRVVVCRGGRLRAKPSPDLYLEACARLGSNPTQSVAVEDSLNGLTAAKRAGLACVAVPNAVTLDLDFSDADVVLPSLHVMSLATALSRL